MKIINKTGTEEVSIGVHLGRVVLDSTITNGELLVRVNTGEITDNSTGAAVVTATIMNPSTIANAVLRESIADHSGVTDSLAMHISDITSNQTQILIDIQRILGLGGDRIKWETFSFDDNVPPRFLSGKMVQYEDDALTIKSANAWLVTQTYNPQDETSTLEQTRTTP